MGVRDRRIPVSSTRAHPPGPFTLESARAEPTIGDVFKKLIGELQSLGEATDSAADRFQDPVALRTEWSPLKGGGTNFKTHHLKKVHAQRMEFRCSLGMVLFGGVFLLIGLGALSGCLYSLIHRGPITDGAIFFILPLFGLVFGSVGFFTLRSAMIPRVFDLAHGYYCRDRRKPEQSFDVSAIRDHVRLDQIHALQLISERCSGKNSSYSSYELNLVLTDGSRLNVVDHGGRQAILRDAEALSNFLGKPLWSQI